MRMRMLRAIWWVSVGVALSLASCVTTNPPNKNAQLQLQACTENIEYKDYERAKTNCQLCLDYNNQSAPCWNGLGLVAYAQNNQDLAVEMFRRALVNSPDFAQSKNNLGAVYFGRGEFEKALPYFKGTMEVDPGYGDGRYNLALTYLRLAQENYGKNEFSKAKQNLVLSEKNYKKLIAVHADNSNGYRDLGVIYLLRSSMQKMKADAQRDLAQSQTYFQQCLDISPQEETCHEQFGQSLALQGQYDQALYQFVQCLAVNKANPSCLKGMNEAYEGSNIKGQAIESYVAMIKADPGNAEGHFGYCEALFDRSLNQMAVSECQTAISLNPKLCLAYHTLGMHFKKTLQASGAKSNCRSYLLCEGSARDEKKIQQCKDVITAVDQKF